MPSCWPDRSGLGWDGRGNYPRRRTWSLTTLIKSVKSNNQCYTASVVFVVPVKPRFRHLASALYQGQQDCQARCDPLVGLSVHVQNAVLDRPSGEISH